MSKDIIELLKAETLETPSATAFRKADANGNVVAVTRVSGMLGNVRWSNDSFNWSYAGQDISENRARELLKDHERYDHRGKKVDFNEKITLANGWTTQKETGLVTLSSCPIPGSAGGLGLFAQGKWVLRDQEGNGIDMDIHLSNLINRHPETHQKS